MLVSMGSHITGSQELAAFGNCRTDDRIDKNASVEELFPNGHRTVIITYVDGNDRGLRFTNIEAQAAIFFTHKCCNFVKALDPLRFCLHDVQGSQSRGGIGGWYAGAENHGTGMVLDVLDNFVIAGDEATKRCEGFAEGGHDEIHVFGHIEMRSSSASAAENTSRVSIIHHQPGTIFFAKRNDGWQGGNVTFHTI